MKNKSKSSIWLISFLIVLLSCCIVGAGIAIAASSTDQYVGDKYAPVITIDYGDFDADTVPDAVINKPYSLFAAKSIDAFGEEIYTHVRVWLFYDSETRSLVNVENGQITPTCYGVYTVEFSSIDRWGNKSVAFYDFECAQKQALTGIVADDNNEYKAGLSVSVNPLTVQNAIGEVTSSAIAILDSNPSVSYPIVDGAFTPLYAGTYSVIYSLSDYNETAEATYSVNVIANSDIIWQSNLELGSYYLVNCTYTLPEVKALTFANGTPTEVAVDITVADNTSALVDVQDGRRVTFSSVGAHTVTYKAENNGKSQTLVQTVDCVDVGFTFDAYGELNSAQVKIEDYFVGDFVSKTANDDSVSIYTETDGASVKFVNSISSRNILLQLSVVKEYADNFSDFDIIITDALDSNNSITINFANQGKETGLLSVSGGRSTKTKETFYSGNILDITYDNATHLVALGSNSAIPVVKFDNGKDFNGFSGDFVFFEIRFNGVNDYSELKLLRIANQSLYKDGGDTEAPEVIFTKFGGGDQGLGDIVKLERVFAFDVICPDFGVSYFVKSPDGKYVKDVNGLELNASNTDYTKEYEFEITQYGKYTISIKANDAVGNSVTYTYNVNVVNLQAVQLQINYDQATTAKLGATVTVCSYSVPGYAPTDVSVRIFIIAPDRVVSQVNENKFIANQRGDYEVWYYVTDADENLDMQRYIVTVA